MLAPLGQFLTLFDTAMINAMDTAIVGLCSIAFRPMIGAFVIFLMVKGLEVMKGEVHALDDILFDVLRISIAIAVASDPAWFNPIVRDFFFTGLPGYLLAGVTSTMHGVNGFTIRPGVNGTGAAIDHVWDMMWIITSAVWGRAGMFDVGTRVAVFFCLITGALALATMALVYLGSRFVLSLTLVLGVIAVALRAIEATRKVFENWLGLVIALTFMQVALIVTLVIIVSIDSQFMDMIAAPGAPTLTSAANAGIASDVQALVSMVVLFGCGAFVIYSIPAVAYTLGSGIAISTAPAMLAMYSSIRSSVTALSKVSAPSVGGGGAAPAPLSLGLASPALGGGGAPLSMSMAATPFSTPARKLLR